MFYLDTHFKKMDSEWYSEYFIIVLLLYAICRYTCPRIEQPPLIILEPLLLPEKYTDIVTENTVRDTCTICIEDFEVGDQVVNLQCTHIFHTKCISPWLEKSTECPNCKSKIKF